MKYKTLPHPAELRLRIYGKTIEELFENAAEALANIQKNNITFIKRSTMKCKKEKIKIKSPDINSLLVDFLSEILAKSQINKMVYQVSGIKCQVLKEDSRLEAEIIGFPIKRFDEDIKAVTYQDVNIHQQPTPKQSKLATGRATYNQQPIWQTDLVFDI